MDVNKLIKLFNSDKKQCLEYVKYSLEFELKQKQTGINDFVRC